MRRGDCLIEMLIRSRGDRGQSSVGGFLWKLHAEIIKNREASLSDRAEGVGSQLLEFDDSELEILSRAYADYRTASSLNGLSVLAHKRVAQLSFLKNDVDGEMMALRRCMSLREGVCRTLFRDGMLALQNDNAEAGLEAFRECLTHRTSYESKILDVSVDQFSKEDIATELLPADPVRIASAANYYLQRNQRGLGEFLNIYADTLLGARNKALVE